LQDIKITIKSLLIPGISRTEKDAAATQANRLICYQIWPENTGFQYVGLKQQKQWTNL